MAYGHGLSYALCASACAACGTALMKLYRNNVECFVRSDFLKAILQSQLMLRELNIPELRNRGTN